MNSLCPGNSSSNPGTSRAGLRELGDRSLFDHFVLLFPSQQLRLRNNSNRWGIRSHCKLFLYPKPPGYDSWNRLFLSCDLESILLVSHSTDVLLSRTQYLNTQIRFYLYITRLFEFKKVGWIAGNRNSDVKGINHKMWAWKRRSRC